MTLEALVEWVKGVPGSLPEEMRPMAESICEAFESTAKRLMDLGLGYLTLDRSASTLSTGERQRGFTRPRHARNAHDLVQRDVHVDVFQVVYLCPAHEHFVYHSGFPSLWLFCAR